jgi:hypothetical protein
MILKDLGSHSWGYCDLTMDFGGHVLRLDYEESRMEGAIL